MKVTKCPQCNCSAYSLDGHYDAKIKGQIEKVRKTRVKCKYCGNRYTLDPIIRNNLPCPYCKHSHTRKEGFYKGRRKYMCINCSKHFQEGAKPHRLTEHQKNMVQVYIAGGFSQVFVAKLVGVGTTTVRRLLGKEK